MKRISFIFVFPFMLFGAVDIGGYLEIGKTSFTGLRNSPYFPIYNDLRIEGKTGSPHLRGVLSFDTRFYDFSTVSNTRDLSSIESLYPLSINLYEAYFSISDFLINNLDLNIGKQRIAWGTADKFNPTDNINPIDLSNPFTFGEHIPTFSVEISYYWNQWALNAIGIPAFTPALLPSDSLLIGAIPVGNSHLPSLLPRNGSYAFKISTNLMNFDMSLSYYYGFDKFPVPDSVGYVSNETYGFDREKVGGFDYSGELFSIGLWGEFAYFMPDRYSTKINTPVFDTLGNIIAVVPIDTSYLKDPYFRTTIGMDYTFPHNIYINVQYVHGMDFERKVMIGNDKSTNPGDYIVGRIEKDIFDNLKMTLAGIGEKRGDSLAYSVIPEIEFHPYDNCKISTGYFQTFGNKGTYFGGMKEYKMAYVKFRFEF